VSRWDFLPDCHGSIAGTSAAVPSEHRRVSLLKFDLDLHYWTSYRYGLRSAGAASPVFAISLDCASDFGTQLVRLSVEPDYCTRGSWALNCATRTRIQYESLGFQLTLRLLERPIAIVVGGIFVCRRYLCNCASGKATIRLSLDISRMFSRRFRFFLSPWIIWPPTISTRLKGGSRL
jgi:hypothetical protein